MMVQTRKVADQADHVNALYYGDGGTGKTTALAAMANLGKVLYIDAEAGVKRRPLEDLGIKTANIELLNERLSFSVLEDVHLQLKAELEDDADAWAGVVWDSGTEIYHALIDNIVFRRVEKIERLKKQGKTVSDVLGDRFFVDRDDYGVMSEQVRNLIRKYRDLPCHFGSSFLERRDQDEKTHEVRIGPSVTPGLQSDLIGWHDIVCHTSFDAADDTYLGTTKPQGVRQGKDRYGVLPKQLIDPLFDRLVAYVAGELDADTDPRQMLNRKEDDATTDDEPAPTQKLGKTPLAAAGRKGR